MIGGKKMIYLSVSFTVAEWCLLKDGPNSSQFAAFGHPSVFSFSLFHLRAAYLNNIMLKPLQTGTIHIEIYLDVHLT